MLSMSHSIKKRGRRLRWQAGQSLFEYAIILAVVALVVIIVLRGIGQYPPQAMTPVNDALQ